MPSRSVNTFIVLTLICIGKSHSATVQENATSDIGEQEITNISIDFNLPVTAKSKNQFLDGKSKTSVFVENVIIKQGSLEILADRVEADASLGKGKEIIKASGKPASYTQRLEDGSQVTAKAREIIYAVGERTLSLKGDASIVQNEVQVTGDAIVFDMAKQQTVASTDENSEESVTTVISPGVFSTEDEPR